MAALIISGDKFKYAELGFRVIRDLLISEEKLDEFEEFHACELYGGYGVFEGIEQPRRFGAIAGLLKILEVFGAKVIYGAVEIDKLQNEVYGSADPLDVCFRICVEGITDWSHDRVAALKPSLPAELESPLREEQLRKFVHDWMAELVLVVMDDCDKKVKDSLQRSYRRLRPRHLDLDAGLKHFFYLHDDLYFGDSKYSTGIQLADLCSYFIARHLEGHGDSKDFFEMIEPHIVFHKLYPTVENDGPRDREPCREDGTFLEGSTEKSKRGADTGEGDH
jgi:hypothetical protein